MFPDGRRFVVDYWAAIASGDELRTAQYREAFVAGFTASVAKLERRDRNLLRLHLLGGVTLEQLATHTSGLPRIPRELWRRSEDVGMSRVAVIGFLTAQYALIRYDLSDVDLRGLSSGLARLTP